MRGEGGFGKTRRRGGGYARGRDGKTWPEQRVLEGGF